MIVGSAGVLGWSVVFLCCLCICCSCLSRRQFCLHAQFAANDAPVSHTGILTGHRRTFLFDFGVGQRRVFWVHPVVQIIHGQKRFTYFHSSCTGVLLFLVRAFPQGIVGNGRQQVVDECIAALCFTGGHIVLEPCFVHFIQHGKWEKIPLCFGKHFFCELTNRVVVFLVLFQSQLAGLRFRERVVIHI